MERKADHLIILIDNKDSFCYNIVQYLRELGEQIKVYRNDQIHIDEIRNQAPDGIIISPGPCSPKEAGISLDVVKTFTGKIPILGVCLGHQAIGEAFGGKVEPAIRPIHGHVEKINHDGKGVFRGLQNPLNVTRYHSLVISKKNLPVCLEVSAWSKSGEIMGIRHKEYLLEGVQFHPEAILTQQGHELFMNFIHSLGGSR